MIEKPTEFIQRKGWIFEDSPTGRSARFLLFIILDTVYYSLGDPLYEFSFVKKIVDPLYIDLSSLIANTCCSLLTPFYSRINLTSDFIIIIDESPVIQMISGCSGLAPMVRMTFVLLPYPVPFFKKLYLWPISIIIIYFAALIHFLLLILVAYEWPALYNFAHNWFSKIIFYSLYFCCWIFWERVGRRGFNNPNQIIIKN